MNRRRWIVSIVSGVVLGIALLLGFAAPRWSSPLSASPALVLGASDWASPSSRLTIEDGGVRVAAEASAGTALAVYERMVLPAANVRYLHYDATEVAPDARLLLLWRGDGELHRAPLPRGNGGAAIDLATVPGWAGDIRMLGIAVLPIDYLAGDAVVDQGFVLRALELRPDNWSSAVSALLTDWFAPRPWTGASINSSGSEFGRPTASLTAFVVLLIMLALGIVRGVSGRDAAARAAPLLVCAGAGLLVLDLAHDMFDRTRTVRHAAAQVAEAPQWPLAADPALAADALQLREVLGSRSVGRVVVYATQPFRRDYTAYLLRQFDVAQLFNLRGFASRPTLGGAVLVLADRDGWNFDAESARLTLGEQSRPAEPLWQGQHLSVFRLGSIEAVR